MLSGVLGYTCNGWTTSGEVVAGLASASWLGAGTYDPYTPGRPTTCGTKLHLYCLGTDYSVNLSYPRATGRIAFVRDAFGYTPDGVAALDGLCAARASDAGLAGTFKALVSATTAAAASRFSTAGPPWVRADGIPIVASAADLFAPGGPVLLAALDVDAFGTTYTSGAMTTGGTSLTSPSSASLDCNDFTAAPSSTFGIAIALPDYTNAMMVNLPGYVGTCASLPGFYCLQE